MGVLLRCGIVVHPQTYVRALWKACQRLALSRPGGGQAIWVSESVESLQQLQSDSSTSTAGSSMHASRRDGRYDAVIIAAGAAVGAFPEVQACPEISSLLQLTQVRCNQ